MQEAFFLTETELYVLCTGQHAYVLEAERHIRAAAAAAAAIAAATAAQLCLVNAVRARDPVTSYRNECCDGKRVVDGVAEQSPVRELHCLQEKHTRR